MNMALDTQFMPRNTYVPLFHDDMSFTSYVITDKMHVSNANFALEYKYDKIGQNLAIPKIYALLLPRFDYLSLVNLSKGKNETLYDCYQPKCGHTRRGSI